MPESSLLDDFSYLDGEEENQFNHAGFLKRMIAYIIDAFIILAINFIVNLMFGISISTVLSLLSYLYFPIMHSSQLQATVGKLFLNIRVVTKSGESLSFMKALGRFVVKYFSFMLIIGFATVLFTQKKQGVHDLVCGTYVLEN